MPNQQSFHKVLDSIAELAHDSGRDPGSIQLVAVTKMRSVEQMQQLYDSGCREMGESRVQEALKKQRALPEDIRWHLIGTLQKNKVKQVIGRFVLIHSVESLELAQEISKQSEKAGVETAVLLQVNCAGEKSKHGLAPEALPPIFQQMINLKCIKICGLMTIAPLTKDEERIRICFGCLHALRDELQRRFHHPLPHLSMGMSGDYAIAIEKGATLLRIGSALF